MLGSERSIAKHCNGESRVAKVDRSSNVLDALRAAAGYDGLISLVRGIPDPCRPLEELSGRRR